MDLVGLGVSRVISVLRPHAPSDSSSAQHSWHQLVIHVCHLHHQANMRVNETGVWWRTERMLDVVGSHVAPVLAWIVNDETVESWT